MNLDFQKYADGKTLCTAFLQEAIDAVPAGGKLTIPAGKYLTGSLFLHSDMTLEIAEGAVILGVVDEKAYPPLPSRVAGIELTYWPAGLINAQNCENLTICGKGLVDGQGEYWWYKFWGTPEENHLGGMIREYPDNLRWAVDYDCFRPQNFLLGNCRNLVIRDLHCERSGFWNLHVYYSENVRIENVTIAKNLGPSTDGIDIDSCNNVVVCGCHISCHDDGIVLKSGRDADGLRVNRPCTNVEIYDCHLMAPSEGITLGSDMSGGISDVYIHDCTFDGARNGFRIKSARTRGGVIERIRVANLKMRDVRYAFSFQLNWFPEFSYCKIPEDYTGEIPEHWRILSQYVPPEKGLPTLRDLTIENVTAVVDEEYEKMILSFLPPEQLQVTDTSRYIKELPLLFDIGTDPARPIENLTFRNMNLSSKTFGQIQSVRNLVLDQVTITACE